MTYDVAIIGGGFSGLNAAHQLVKSGFKTVLLEARQSLGGRISKPFPTTLFDSKNQSYPLKQFLKSHQVKIHDFSNSPAIIFNKDGRSINLNALPEAVRDKLNQMLRIFKEATKDPAQKYQSISNILGFEHQKIGSENSETWLAYALIRETLIQNTGAPLYDLSLLEFLQPTHNISTKTVLIENMGDIIEQLYQEAQASGNMTLFLNAVVQKVQYRPQHKPNVFCITLENGNSYDAKAVVVAVPFSILKANKISFDPPLSHAKRAALKHFGISHYNQIELEFDKVFWEKDALYLYPKRIPSDRLIPYLNGYSFSKEKTPYLIAQFSGLNACFGKKTDEALIQEVLKPLKETYPNCSPLKSFSITRFDSDRNILGGSLYFSTQVREQDIEGLQRDEYPGLFFSGDYLDLTRHGSLEAAYESSIKAFLKTRAYLHYLEGLTQKPSSRGV